LTYRWNFGDGLSSSPLTNAWATHAYNSPCGPNAASVVVSNSLGVISSNLSVSVACDLDVTSSGKLSAKLKFSVPDGDSARLKGRIDLGDALVPFSPAGLKVKVSIGGAVLDFTLDEKGRGVNGSSTCHLAFSKASASSARYWTITVKLSQGNWQSVWLPYGLLNQDFVKPGKSAVNPVQPNSRFRGR
jgi:hypothetical protein